MKENTPEVSPDLFCILGPSLTLLALYQRSSNTVDTLLPILGAVCNVS